MRKVVLLFLMVLCGIVSSFSQEPIKFLGIPVDGTRVNFVRQLQSKGFIRNIKQGQNTFRGEFNGRNVNVSVVDYHGKVWRVLVSTDIISEKDIKISFNNLVYQFDRNKKYFSLDSIQTISEQEDVYFGILQNKRYEANYYLRPTSADQELLSTEYSNQIRKQYGEKKFKDLSEGEINKFYNETLSWSLTRLLKNHVWFMIDKLDNIIDSYQILLFYDNEANHDTDSDL